MNDSSGRVPTWPTAPQALADPHRCPVCFTDVSPGRCRTCGFEFSDPDALRVLALGREILRLETERRRKIDVIFASTRVGMPRRPPARRPSPAQRRKRLRPGMMQRPHAPRSRHPLP